MVDGSAERLDLRAVLEAVEAAPPVGAAEALGRVLARVMDARDVGFLIADFSGQSLVRVGHGAGGVTTESVALDGTPHGRALADQTVETVAEGDGVRVLAPVTTRGEAVGILELVLPAQPTAQQLDDLALAGHAMAYVIIANRRFTDLYEWGQRTVPLSLAAEIQHRLLPGSYTCEAGQLTVAGWLEPAGDVGGDTFDFSLEHETLHVSITDAMGHTVEASLLATVLVGALRNARRAGAPLGDQARLAHQAFTEQVRPGQFVTGQVMRVDLRAGTAQIVNAGHPPPLRLRDGRVEQLALLPDLPFGALPATEYRVQDVALAPGDRYVFLTDGMLGKEGRSEGLVDAVLETLGHHAREAVQLLTRKILADNGGHLDDDATVLVLDWHGGEPRERSSTSGADR